jgi:hypothetical protein
VVFFVFTCDLLFCHINDIDYIKYHIDWNQFVINNPYTIYLKNEKLLFKIILNKKLNSCFRIKIYWQERKGDNNAKQTKKNKRNIL